MYPSAGINAAAVAAAAARHPVSQIISFHIFFFHYFSVCICPALCPSYAPEQIRRFRRRRNGLEKCWIDRVRRQRLLQVLS